MTTPIEDLEDEMSAVLEENMCLKDDVVQLQAELQAIKTENNEGNAQAFEGLATFMYLAERRSDRELHQLHDELRNKGYSYETRDQRGYAPYPNGPRDLYQNDWRGFKFDLLLSKPRQFSMHPSTATDFSDTIRRF